MSSIVHFEIPADDIQRAKHSIPAFLDGRLLEYKAWTI
jgi:hypothetical protein